MNFGLEELEEIEILDEVELLKEIEKGLERDLIVYNDDINTFEHVTNTLIKVCKHAQEQAEQCTYIVHFKGKCAVKKGTLNALRPMKEGITDAGIKAAIV
jgi:ATP-dependent Clp protease adaptor protein ClpS